MVDPLPDCLSREFDGFIRECLRVNANERPSAARALLNPIFSTCNQEELREAWNAFILVYLQRVTDDDYEVHPEHAESDERMRDLMPSIYQRQNEAQ